MNTKIIKFSSIVLLSVSLLAWITPKVRYQMVVDNELIKKIRKSLESYNSTFPEDRIYLNSDKPMYEPGDDIWFSAFLVDARTMKGSEKSDIVHVELINPKGNIERSLNIVAKNGIAAGDFNLDKELVGGLYKIKAYTNWMKNAGENNVFEKEIQVQKVVLPNLKMKLDFERKAFGPGDQVIAKLQLNTNENKPLANHKIKIAASIKGVKLEEKTEVSDEEGIRYIKFNLPKDLSSNDGLLNVMIDYNGNVESISRSIPIVLNKIEFSLFPEGGELVVGMKSNVAFKAINEFGKPADVEGELIDSKGKTIAQFSSFHQGMGAFDFTPAKNENYTVKLTKPEGIKTTYKMPEALSLGYVLGIEKNESNELGVSVQTTEAEELSLVAQVRGEIYYSTALQAKKGENHLLFPTSNFPAGVCQITLFDSKGIERAERLVFVNKHKQLNVSITPDKEKYLPREKVKLTISVKDEKGLPAPANLSLSVVNDQFLSFADDKSGNILSQMLLQQDIKEKIEEPAFYFDVKEPKADKALDYLLMTAGWRRFEWQKVLIDPKPYMSFNGEKALLEGIVYDANTMKPLKNAKIKLLNGPEYTTDEKGKFTITKVDLSTPANLTYSANGFQNQTQYINMYNQNMAIYMYKPSPYYYSYSGTNKPQSKGNKKLAVAEEAMGNGNWGEVPMALDDQVMAQPGVVKNAELNIPKAAVNQNENKNKEDKKQDNKKKEADALVKDERQAVFGNVATVLKPAQLNNASVYYRARKFYSPEYFKDENVEVRTDFRNTVYWNPAIEINHTGKKTVEFCLSDNITSFKAIAEGIGTEGTIGRGDKTFFSQLPFGMSVKIPLEVATEDVVSIPLTLSNNTDKPLGGALKIIAPDALKALNTTPEVQTVMPGKSKTIFLDYKVLNVIGEKELTVSFKACGLGDAFTQKITIKPKGFPVSYSFSGQEKEKEFDFSMKNRVNGSLKINFTAFPSVVSDLMKGVESILREPYGCFEQTSMSSYPNAMVLDYLKSSGSNDDKTISRATALLEKGYNRLLTFETKEQGYEWFGSNPGHEALTAYGLMQFYDMKNAGGNVDQKMIDRTAQWLMSKKDGKGGFERNSRALDNFGRASKEITDAYIVYALSEAGFTNISKEFNVAYDNAMSSKDPYMLGLVTCAAYNLKEVKKGDASLQVILKKQEKDGSLVGQTHSITYSQGQSLTIETTSLAIMSILKSSNKDVSALSKAVQFIVNSRNGYGSFGNTQGTVLALKSLTEYAKFSKKTDEAGAIVVYIDGKKVARKEYKAGETDAIVIDSLEKFVGNDGKHSIKVKYEDVKNPLPYSIVASWNTVVPESNTECSVLLDSKLALKEVTVGETVRLSNIIKNKKSEGLPATMAIIGIPAGFTVQPWQLKELQEKKAFDYYEIKGNNLALYYRCMAPNDIKEVNLDLKAEMPGEYQAPASSAYLYYTNEFKTWSGAEKVIIKKQSL